VRKILDTTVSWEQLFVSSYDQDKEWQGENKLGVCGIWLSGIEDARGLGFYIPRLKSKTAVRDDAIRRQKWKNIRKGNRGN